MTAKDRSAVQIKGIKEGLLISLGEGVWDELQVKLLEQVDERSSFFQGARLALDVGNLVVRAADLGTLRDRLSAKGISLWAVISQSPITEQTAQMLGLATRISTPRAERTIKALDTNLSGEGAVLVHRTLRSGYKVENHGHVIVIGDVNPGAEIVAGGSVVVWGRLRGMVHAGADGDETAVVCALDLKPTQLRIATLISVPPRNTGKNFPEIASVENGQVVAEPWKPKEK